MSLSLFILMLKRAPWGPTVLALVSPSFSEFVPNFRHKDVLGMSRSAPGLTLELAAS